MGIWSGFPEHQKGDHHEAEVHPVGEREEVDEGTDVRGNYEDEGQQRLRENKNSLQCNMSFKYG